MGHDRKSPAHMHTPGRLLGNGSRQLEPERQRRTGRAVRLYGAKYLDAALRALHLAAPAGRGQHIFGQYTPATDQFECHGELSSLCHSINQIDWDGVLLNFRRNSLRTKSTDASKKKHILEDASTRPGRSHQAT